MLAIRRAGAEIPSCPRSVFPLNAEGRAIFSDMPCCWGDIEYDPVIVHPIGTQGCRNIGIVHDESEAFRTTWDIYDVKRWVDSFSFACIKRRDGTIFFKGRAR